MTTPRAPEWERAAHPEDEIWMYRGDMYELAGVRGGKVRACWELVKQCIAEDRPGLVTAGSRHSPQVEIVAALGHAAAIPVRAYVPAGDYTPAIRNAVRLGAEVLGIRPGYNGVIRARAREDAAATDWLEVPFGMECRQAVEQARLAIVAAGIPEEVSRLVVPCGSGMTLAGLLWGLDDLGRTSLPVLAVQVGADPTGRLDRWAPAFWRMQTTIQPASIPYRQEAPPEWVHRLGPELDAVYEAKAIPELEEGDGLWIVGRRGVER